MSLSRLWWTAFAVVSALRVAVAFTFPLQGDEAYYWMWSRHLAAGYYDHPPLIAWGIRAGTLLLGHSALGVRLPALIGTTFATWCVWKLGCRLGGEAVGARAGLAALAFPYFTYLSFTAFPDGLMLGFAALALVLAWQDRWLWAGVAMGFSGLAKFPAVFLAAGTLLWRRSPRSLALWATAGLLIISPFLAWNATHDWATFAFQFGARQSREGHFRPLGPLNFMLVQAAVASPILWIFLISATFWAFRQRTNVGRFLSLHGIVPLGIFALAALQHQIQPHWPLIGYLTAFVALGMACESSVPGTFPWGWSRGVSLGFMLLALCFTLLIFPSLLFQAFGRPQGSGLTEPFGIAQFGPELAQRRLPREFLLAENHGIAASLEFYSGLPVHWYSHNLHGRQYLQWEDYTSMMGEGALFVDVHPMRERPDVKEMLKAAFDEVGPAEAVLVRWHGFPARTFYLTHLRGFRGKSPVSDSAL